jgi:hypothetical protein
MQVSRAEKSVELAQKDLSEKNAQMVVLETEKTQLEKDRSAFLTECREEDEKEDRAKCAICLANQVDCKLDGCPHLFCLCCVGQLRRNTCPICRKWFRRAEKVIF